MGEHRRKADGRRVFSTEFKRSTFQRILTGEKTLAELSREVDISPSVIRNWKRFAEAGATTAVQASEDVVPASHLREAYAKIRELERALGRKTMEVEILRSPGDRKKNSVVAQRVRAVTTYSMSAICSVLGIARRTAYYVVQARPGGRYHPRRRPHSPAADPGGDEQPGDLRLSPSVGDGEPHLPGRLQPQADSPCYATPRADAGASGAPSPRTPAPRPDSAAGVEPALVLRRLLDSLLEWRGHLRGLRH
jgi:transposase